MRVPRATSYQELQTFDALLLPILLQNLNQNLALGRWLRLRPLPGGRYVHVCGASWPRGASSSPDSPCDMLALPTGVRLRTSGRTLAGPSPGAYHLWLHT